MIGLAAFSPCRRCSTCGAPATCVGRYEVCEGPFELACNECCGHGNEDGVCHQLDSIDPAEVDRLLALEGVCEE